MHCGQTRTQDPIATPHFITLAALGESRRCWERSHRCWTQQIYHFLAPAGGLGWVVTPVLGESQASPLPWPPVCMGWTQSASRDVARPPWLDGHSVGARHPRSGSQLDLPGVPETRSGGTGFCFQLSLLEAARSTVHCKLLRKVRRSKFQE